jgi:hypothetical protein
MIATCLPPADFLRLVAARVERGEDCKGYAAGLRRTADLVESVTHEWHWINVPVLREFEQFLERRRRKRDRTAS